MHPTKNVNIDTLGHMESVESGPTCCMRLLRRVNTACRKDLSKAQCQDQELNENLV